MSDRTDGAGFDPGPEPALRVLGLAAWAVVLGLVAAVAWSLIASVHQVARARGAVEPIEQVQRVESVHGGVLAQLLVRRGDPVRAGQVIARFDGTEARAALNESDRRLGALSIEIERLSALVEGRRPDFARFAEAFPRLIPESESAFQARLALIETQETEARQRIAGKLAEIAALEEQLPAVQRQLAVAREAGHTIAALVNQGLAPRPRLVELIEQEARFAVDLAQLSGRRTLADADLAGLQQALARVRQEEATRARERIAEARGQLRVVEAQRETLQQRANELEIRTPVAGLVQSVPETRSGDVIEPGGLIARIVPEGGVRFTARLAPRDVGFVTAGQRVRVKADSFDFARYGTTDGIVERVSPTTIVDEHGVAFYEVLINLPKPFFRAAADGYRLLPGMTGEADIITGRHTVFEYLWQPVFTQLDLVFAER